MSLIADSHASTGNQLSKDSRRRSGFCLIGAIALVTLASGCVPRSTAVANARAAYLAGQRDAIALMSRQQAAQGEGPAQIANLPSNVTLIGPVQNPMVPWSAGLTLARAIVTAVYDSPIDPTMITIKRSNEEVQVHPSRLLSGGDYPLKPGDIIEFHLPDQ